MIWQEWRRKLCPHCATNMGMSEKPGYHWTGSMNPPKCLAPAADEMIAALESRLFAIQSAAGPVREWLERKEETPDVIVFLRLVRALLVATDAGEAGGEK